MTDLDRRLTELMLRQEEMLRSLSDMRNELRDAVLQLQGEMVAVVVRMQANGHDILNEDEFRELIRAELRTLNASV